jgi:glucose-6-phosphate isomerase
MSLKLNLEGLNTNHLLLEVPKVFENQKSDVFKRFVDQCGNPETRLSSYRCTEKLSLDFEKSLALAVTFRNKFKRLFLLGTGGSSLGSKAILESLKNKVDREIIFIENLDASDLPVELTAKDFSESAVLAISKSGNTLETLLALSFFENKFQESKLTLKNHFVIITDKDSKSALASWADTNGVEKLFLDPLLGGRWSVSSVVGTFPLAFAGLDAKAFFNGISSAFQAPPKDETIDFALRCCDLEKSNYLLHSLWLYSSRLKEIGAWWRQLWSESLGKQSGGISKGAFALPCVGAVDQHSILQQLVEGHSSSYSGFILISKTENDFKVENLTSEIAQKFSKCVGKSWSDLRNNQGKATLQALSEKGRPTYLITIDSLNEKNLGVLMAFWMDVVALVGAGLKVNPFNQPGVERAKKILDSLL